MRIPNSDFLERAGSESIGARLWRLPPKSANTLRKHLCAGSQMDLSLVYPVDPKQLPKELAGVEWPPKG